MDELPDNFMEALENAGYECEVSTTPFSNRGDIETDENL
jgi:hypothetical protein